MTTDAWGVDDEYYDALGTHRVTSAKTRAAIHAAMGVEPGKDRQAPPVLVLRSGQQHAEPLHGQLQLESGERREIDGPLPADLPPGYHDFYATGKTAGDKVTGDGQPLRIIVSPGRCFLPADLRVWGWAVQLYSTRSRASWGIGDLADLARLGAWARPLGAALLVVNPLDAVPPILPQESSPYFPTSRRFLNPIYLSIDAVPGYAQLNGELAPLAAAAQALNAQRQIDRDAVYRLKMTSLEKLWRAFAGDDAFEHFVVERGESLRHFAIYSTLAEKFGGNWHAWDGQYHDPNGPAVRAWAEQSADRVRFFTWLQWLADGQLAAAAKQLKLLKDLPIGASPDGFDTWSWQHLHGRGVAMGAPPDLFNTQGQNWGLPPLAPHKLQMARYEPFVEIVRAGLRHAGGLRIDHVIGLFRSFWVPNGFGAQEGAYVRYPVDDLLAILALESQRAGALIIGEDLGTVEAGTRERLAAHDILSYALLYFERGRPSDYPAKALAAITTHDLPTLAGLWSGSDLVEQIALQLSPDRGEEQALRQRLAGLTGLAETASIDALILAAHAALAQARSMLVVATLEDALAVPERPNIPNTTSYQRPNWSRALPVPLDDFAAMARPAELARILSAQRGKNSGG
ncbi:MAG TPA: 4-alpha-glucanotransferase [Pirellulales bacterium]|jgi:4-alpha-glucanotransferase|nr:4-alpha-glucanotransferase [Pirellulales bacterium]